MIPSGVQITKIGFYWYDESPTSAIGFYVYEYEPGNATYNDMLGIYSGDTGNGQTSIDLPYVGKTWITDNNQYIYTISVTFSGYNKRFYGAFIEYEYPT